VLTTSQRKTIQQVKQAIESFENTGDPFFLADLGILIHVLWEAYSDVNEETVEYSQANLN